MDDDFRDRFRGVSKRSVVNSPPASRVRATRPVVASPPVRVVDRLDPMPEQSPQTKPAPPTVKMKTRRRKSYKGKRLLIVILCLLGLGATAYAYKKYYPQTNNSTVPIQDQPVTSTKPNEPQGTIRLIAVGDSLAFESINSAAKQADGSYNYLPMMSGLKPFFDKSDIRLCNETTPSGGDKDGLSLSAYPTFNAPLAWSSGFTSLGCNVVNLASNHMNDKGQPAIDNTLSTLNGSANVLAIAGANRSAEDQSKVRYFSVKGVKFAFLAYATESANKQGNPFSVNIYSEDLANRQTTEARKNAQLVIVAMNWGKEDSSDISVEQDKIAQNLANQNVDVVVGGGPYVVQPTKILSGSNRHQTLVWFSLGNFLNSELNINNLVGGMAVMDFDIATKQLNNPKLMPVYMHYEWTAAQKAANNVNARQNFMLYPLDLATMALAKSQNNTTVDAQTKRITDIISKFAPVKVIKSTEF